MAFRFSLLIFLTCGICISTIGQVTLTGVMLDSDNQTALPYVNIGIKRKAIGTTSFTDGKFSILIPPQNEKDTLTFSMVGYDELSMPIQAILLSNQKTFQLKVKATALNAATITSKKLTESDFGIKNNRTAIHFADGSTNQNDIFEIAQLIPFDTLLSKVTSVSLYINEPRNDSGTFRINFYGFDGIRPTERIVEKSIVQTKKIMPGWMKFDLTPYNVYLKGNFVVALEFIPTTKKTGPIYYEIKLGGSSKSFLRTSSQGEWSVPPHHYRLFITALVANEGNQNRQADIEDKETTPTKILYSASVKDSFHLFIHLPKHYANKKNKHFPVLYLLDANVYFDLIANEMEKKNTEAILVGIGYKNFLLMDSLRNRDFLYPRVSIPNEPPIGGGANLFLTFIQSELIPYIHKTYSTDTVTQTLMGHSFGGYFVLYTLLNAIQNNNHTFKNYVAASPSLEYSDAYLLKELRLLSDHTDYQKNLLVTYGGKEDSEDGETGTEVKDYFNLLVALLSDSRFKNIRLKHEVYPSFGHMETACPTFFKTIQETR